MRYGEDWLSHTMRRVDAVMKEHGFEEDAHPKPEAQAAEIIPKKRWSLKALLRAASSRSSDS
jgi:hypothetical protein